MKLYRAIAGKLIAIQNCIASGDTVWQEKHQETLDAWCREYLPSGSGFDSGTKLDQDASTADKLVFTTSFNHMDDGGGYCGWTDHKVTIKPSLYFEFDITVSGRNRNDIKDYIAEQFHAIGTDIDVDAF